MITEEAAKTAARGMLLRLCEQTADGYFLDQATRTAFEYVRNFINYDAVPDGLSGLMTEMIAGHYLRLARQNELLRGSQCGCESCENGENGSFDYGAAVKSIQQGDTTLTFADGMSDEQRFDAAVEHLISGREGLLYRYRRVCW